MLFVVLACTDIRGEKLNVELPFREPPDSLAEFYRILERVFRGEENDVKAKKAETSTHPSEPFTVSRVQRYEEDTQMWVELGDVRQLHLHDQLYVFRRHATRADISTRRDIPAPRRSPYFFASRALGLANTSAEPELNLNRTSGASPSPPAYSSVPQRPLTSAVPRNEGRNSTNGTIQTLPVHQLEGSAGVTQSNAAPVPTVERRRSDPSTAKENLSSEQVGVVFAAGDSSHRGYLTLRDFQGMLNTCEIQFPAEAAEELHRCFATEKCGEAVMGFRDFQNFAREFVQTASVAYTRLVVRERQRVIEQEQRDNASALDGLQTEMKALEERLELVQRHIARNKEKETRLRSELDELRRLDYSDYREQEQRLLSKEVVVFRYRQKLQEEESDYERLVAERRQQGPNMSLGQGPVQAGGYSYEPRECAVAAAVEKKETKQK
ncbi:calmodulin-like protein containing EF hand [Trypanosoma conorhini]|uniref:Calmodulin-like protein containing EF hand n=1 Tax=Trypanosoma conorhini TaxID=83891 RepID=A0A422P6Q4_9TRYP|nr:calmodulin-like protein containing EF hand [Trypanosoma conorhini]RNF13402.1 calmodulin-like protein containing EF hand [Trypanosoma conorhini]